MVVTVAIQRVGMEVQVEPAETVQPEPGATAVPVAMPTLVGKGLAA